MTKFQIAPLALAATVATLLVLPTMTAFAEEQYYANPTLPHPEITGPKITRSDVQVVANAANPHPELRGTAAVAVAKVAPSK